MILAASIEGNIAIAIAVVVTLGLIVFFAADTRNRKEEIGAEIELAPNRKPYYEDEILEGRRLEGALGSGLLLLTIVAVGLPVYWLFEPDRQIGAVENYEVAFANRGETTYEEACASCHASGGVGGVAPFIVNDRDGNPVAQVAWRAPALTSVLLRYSEDEVFNILTYGRGFSPMPAWGKAGGGAFTDQEITNVIAYLNSIQLSPEESQQDAIDRFGETDGEALFNEYCARCHTFGWSYFNPNDPEAWFNPNDPDQLRPVPGGGALGPSLLGDGPENQFPTVEGHVDFIINGANFGEAYGRSGLGSGQMPAFGLMLTETQIRAIVDYERNEL